MVSSLEEEMREVRSKAGVTEPDDNLPNRRRRRTPYRRSRSNYTETPSCIGPEDSRPPPRGCQRDSQSRKSKRGYAETGRPPSALRWSGGRRDPTS